MPHPISEIRFPAVERSRLSNGVPVFIINAGSQEVLRFELIYDAGRRHEMKRGIAQATAKLLLEGTSKKSAQQIAEETDYFGATLGAEAAVDCSILSLTCLTRHAEPLFELLRHVTSDSVFPEKELHTYVQNSKQRLQVNLEKVDFLAQKNFAERMYGAGHPAGYTTTENDFDSLNTDALKKFCAHSYQPANLKILLSGKITDEVVRLLEKNFGGSPGTAGSSMPADSLTIPEAGQLVFTERKDAVQSAIRMGKRIVTRRHPDYPALKVLNTVLGGYFGSRLMSNLREEKGYCYGVHSGIASFLQEAHFFIATEVGCQFTSSALDEMNKELNRLRTEWIPADELQLVRNYLLGSYLSDVDGPFNAAEILRSLIINDLDEDFFYRQVETTRNATSEILQQLAMKYFDPGEMFSVVVGKMN